MMWRQCFPKIDAKGRVGCLLLLQKMVASLFRHRGSAPLLQAHGALLLWRRQAQDWLEPPIVVAGQAFGWTPPALHLDIFASAAKAMAMAVSSWLQGLVRLTVPKLPAPLQRAYWPAAWRCRR